MSYHYTPSSTSNNTTQSTTNDQRQVAPPGYHYMPDGTLMSDIEHNALYGNNVIESQVVTNFNLDSSDIPAAGSVRNFSVLGTEKAKFSLEIKNANNYYYNFTTKLFQESQTKLYDKVIGNGYSDSVTFPSIIATDTVNGAVSSGVKVVMDTVVANTMSVGDRVTGNTVLNSTVVTVAALNPDGDNTSEFSLSSAVALDDGITLSFTGGDQYDFYLFAENGTTHAPRSEVRFIDGTIDENSSSGSNSLLLRKVIYQYSSSLLTMSAISSSGTISISKTDNTLEIFRGKSNVKTPFTITATSASTKSFKIIKQPTSNDILSFLELTVGSDPENLYGENPYPAVTAVGKINVAVSGSTTVTIDGLSANPKIGDKFEIIDGPNSSAAQIVTAVHAEFENITSSVAISADNDKAIHFSNQVNYQWPLNNIDKVTEGMIVVAGTNVTTDTIVSRYEESITTLAGTSKARTIVQNSAPAKNTLGQKPTIEKGIVTTQAGNVVFDKQQGIALAGDTIKIGGYGTSQILNVSGYEILFSDLAVALTPITTTTTAASTASTSVVVAARDGILNTVSTVSGIGINASAAAPTVNSGASASGAGTIVLSAAQSLENGVTLTFPGAGKVITITGTMEILKAGIGNPTLSFDVDKLVTST